MGGAEKIIDKLLEKIPDVKKEDIDNAQNGFRLLFSMQPFPGAYKMVWKRANAGGNYYYSDDFKMEGWLCASLFKYFPAAPRTIYAKAELKK